MYGSKRSKRRDRENRPKRKIQGVVNLSMKWENDVISDDDVNDDDDGDDSGDIDDNDSQDTYKKTETDEEDDSETIHQKRKRFCGYFNNNLGNVR